MQIYVYLGNKEIMPTLLAHCHLRTCGGKEQSQYKGKTNEIELK